MRKLSIPGIRNTSPVWVSGLPHGSNSPEEQFVGLTGEERAIKAAQSTVNLPIAKGAPGYGHATFMLAYSKDNLTHVIYPSGITQGDRSEERRVGKGWRRRCVWGRCEI